MSLNDKYMYVMQCKEFVKFGISQNPNQRIKELQTGNPFKITLLLSINYGYGYDIETNTHNYFKDKQEIGEWFKIDEEIKSFVKYLKHIEYNIGDYNVK